MTAEGVAQIHDEAMALADVAELAKLRGDRDGYSSAIRSAFVLERQAALAALEFGIDEPTRSVLLRSAASLGYECGEYESAEHLIHVAMAGAPPDFMKDELRELLENVTATRHLGLSGVRLGTEEFQFFVAGPEVGHGFVPVELLWRRVDSVRGMIDRTAERFANEPFRSRGRRPQHLRQVPVYMSAGRPGSFAVTFRIGQPALFPELDLGSRIVREVIENIERIDDGRINELKQAIPDPAYFNSFVGAAKQIAPDGKGITSVGFTPSPETDLQPTVLRRTADLMPEPLEIPDSDPKDELEEPSGPVKSLVGFLRRADGIGGRHEIALEPEGGGQPQKIDVPEGLDDILKSHWGEFVEVRARLRGKRLRLVDIQSVG